MILYFVVGVHLPVELVGTGMTIAGAIALMAAGHGSRYAPCSPTGASSRSGCSTASRAFIRSRSRSRCRSGSCSSRTLRASWSDCCSRSTQLCWWCCRCGHGVPCRPLRASGSSHGAAGGRRCPDDRSGAARLSRQLDRDLRAGRRRAPRQLPLWPGIAAIVVLGALPTAAIARAAGRSTFAGQGAYGLEPRWWVADNVSQSTLPGTWRRGPEHRDG